MNLADVRRVANYALGDGGLHVAMYFGLVESTWDPQHLTGVIHEAAGQEGLLGWVLSSHDRPRAATRFGGGDVGAMRTLLLTAVTSSCPAPASSIRGTSWVLRTALSKPKRRATPSSPTRTRQRETAQELPFPGTAPHSTASVGTPLGCLLARETTSRLWRAR